MDFFSIFGCVAHSLTPSQQREKFAEKGEICIFIGCSDESKGFCLYNPNTKEFVIAHDVIFDDDASWDFTRKVAGKGKAIYPPIQERILNRDAYQ